MAHRGKLTLLSRMLLQRGQMSKQGAMQHDPRHPGPRGQSRLLQGLNSKSLTSRTSPTEDLGQRECLPADELHLQASQPHGPKISGAHRQKGEAFPAQKLLLPRVA